MKLKHVLLCFSLFAVFAISFNASAGEKAKSKKESNSEKAKEILEKAKRSGISFISLSKVGNGEEMKQYEKITPDGIKLTRTEFVKQDSIDSKSRDKSVHIFDGVNRWIIYDDIAINEKYLVKITQKILQDVNLKNKQRLVYKLKKVKYNKIPCFEVTETDISPSLPEKNVKVVKYIIGKNNFFIYSTETFTKQGKRLSLLSYDNVKFTESLDNKLFKVPEKCKIYIAETFDEFKKYNAFIQYKHLLNDPKLEKMLKKHLKKTYGTIDIYELLNKVKYETNKEK